MAIATAARPVEITLPPLHSNQRAIARHPARFKVVCCGRRWGKTMLAIVVALIAALKGQRIWWIAPTYQEGLEGWRYLLKLVARIPNVGVHQVGLTVNFPGGGSIQVKTADNPDNLRGAGLDGVVFDEAAVMNAMVWELVIRPALADKQGWALFISTPQHFNWFYDLWARGQDDAYPDWASWQLPTWDNPFIAEGEIEAARGEMTEEDFEQEFGASFTAVGGAVFRTLGLNRPIFLRPRPHGLEFERVGDGMDWGTTKAHDASVVCGASLKSGVVWYLSAWLDHEGGDTAWLAEAERTKKDYGATFARVDRSQSSILGRLRDMGFDAETGVANVEARIGAYGGLFNPQRPAAFFDSMGPGIVQYFNHMCGYHRDRDGKIVEEEDDDVDAGGYLTCELVAGIRQDSPAVRVVLPSNTEKRTYGGLVRKTPARSYGGLGGRRG